MEKIYSCCQCVILWRGLIIKQSIGAEEKPMKMHKMNYVYGSRVYRIFF